MLYLHDSMIFVSNSKNTLAAELKTILREFNHELIYLQHGDEVLRILTDHKRGILFVDSSFHIYKHLLANLTEKSELFLQYIVVYIDDDFHKYDGLINNRNYFVIPRSYLRDGIYQLLSELTLPDCGLKNVSPDQIKKQVSSYLVELGMVPSFAGFKYICQSVVYILKRNVLIRSLQKEIYPLVAIKYKTHINNIDRNIRSVIQFAIDSEAYLSTDVPRDKMTPRALLVFLAEKVYMLFSDFKNALGNPNDPLTPDESENEISEDDELSDDNQNIATLNNQEFVLDSNSKIQINKTKNNVPEEIVDFINFRKIKKSQPENFQIEDSLQCNLKNNCKPKKNHASGNK